MILYVRVQISSSANLSFLEGKMTTDIYNSTITPNIFITLADYMEWIQPGERIKYYVPKELYIIRNEFGNEDWNLEFMEDIQIFVRGKLKSSNLFVTLRFKKKETELMVDMYLLPK